jgi:hypothetical protein
MTDPSCCDATVTIVARTQRAATCPDCGGAYLPDPATAERAAWVPDEPPAQVAYAPRQRPPLAPDGRISVAHDPAPARPSLVGPHVAASDCDACPLAEMRHDQTGGAQVCVCGRVYADEGFTWPAPAAPPELAPAVRELAVAIEDLRTLRRWAGEERDRTRIPLARSVNPIGRMMGLAGGASVDATDAQVQALARQVFGPLGRVGIRRREDFIRALLLYCDETSRPLDEVPVDAAVGRALAARLAALPYDTARVLRVLGRRCGPSTSWEDAVAVVVDELLPVPAVSVFRPVGRPRVDRASAPPEVQREARAEAMLRDAVRAWEHGR